MLRRLFLTMSAISIAVTISCAAQNTSQIVLPVHKTAATSVVQMYTSYCAPCHGIDGRGHGPLAPALRQQPANLTLLSRSHQGHYPDARIVSVVQFGAGQSTHGAAAMPAWGPILAKMNQANHQDRLLRLSNLSRYLDSLQAP